MRARGSSKAKTSSLPSRLTAICVARLVIVSKPKSQLAPVVTSTPLPVWSTSAQLPRLPSIIVAMASAFDSGLALQSAKRIA
jgi:hypothetical protein